MSEPTKPNQLSNRSFFCPVIVINYRDLNCNSLCSFLFCASWDFLPRASAFSACIKLCDTTRVKSLLTQHCLLLAEHPQPRSWAAGVVWNEETGFCSANSTSWPHRFASSFFQHITKNECFSCLGSFFQMNASVMKGFCGFQMCPECWSVQVL